MSPNDPSICEGDSVTFSITPNGETNYEFFLNGVSEQSSNVNTYGHSGLVDNDEVSVEVTFTNGCAAMSDTITMTVDDTVDAVISVTDGNTHCSEAEVEINASPTGIGATYDFFLNGENVQSGSNTVLTGAYTVDQNIQLDITTTDGCTSSTTDFITINTTPDVDLNNSTSNDSICAGGSVSFTAAGSADNYNFFKNDVSVQNTASDTYLDNTISDGDEFYVIASSNGCHDTTSITTIGLSTGITATLNSGHAGNLICDGFAMTFTGNGGDNFTFFYNNVQVQDGTDNTYDIADPQDQDEISLIVTSGLCADTVENQIITVADTPVAAISMTTDSICLGQCVTYTASGGTSYQFILNNTDTLGALSATSSIDLCDLDNNDRMTLIASNGTCTDLTYSGLIEVAPNPDIELTLRDSAICQGEQAVLDVTSNGERFEYFTDNISDYVGTDDSRVYNNLNNGQELKVTARLGHCYTTDSISIIVHDLPEVALSQNQVCTGQQVEITENRNGSGTMDFVFGINGTDFSSTQDNIFLPSNGSVDNGDRVHVIVSNAHCSNFDTIILVLDSINTTLTSTELDLEICTGTPVNFNATGGSTYTFYVNGVDMQGPSISPTYGTTTLQNGDIISVEVEASNGCSNTETLAPFTVHQYDNANFSYPADTLCNIGNASPTLEGINTTGSWSSIPSVGLTLHNSRGDISLDRSEPATYTIIYTTDGECPDADTAQVNIVEAPSRPYAGEDQVLCNTNSITLNADYLDVGTGTWTISNGTGNISNPNNELTTVSDLTVGDTTTLVWTSFSSVHCPTYSDEINITIIDADIVIEAGENILCYDSIITLDATAPTIANTGTWTSASGNITFTDDHDPNTSIIGMEPNVNETITWSILDTFCNITGSDDLTIFNQLTEFNISPEKEDELILLELDFMLSDFDSLTSWTWYIDGEEVATGGSSISHTFYEPGAHEVIVNGIDTKGCSTSRTIIYNSEEGDELFIPTSFTPDGETNNIFAPTGHLIHYSEYSFKIFNRWGQMVYESYVPHEGWDGTFRNSGTLLPMDGYSYMLVLTDSQGNQTLRKGTIVLIR
jgi:gliding motility-associated-like protein